MRGHSETSDHELLELLRHDEHTSAFDEIYKRYWDKLYGAAYKRVKSPEAAEEIVQELFTDLWERRKILNIRSELPVYLFSAIKYKVITYIHKEIVKNNYAHTHFSELSYYDNSTEEKILVDDLNSCLQSQVQLLPVKCKQVFEMSRNGHQSNKQIASQLGISEKTVENQITKALRRLRTSLGVLFFFL